ncbi:MAG TPA: GNAT family N-acetyltransferase [Pirellulaceae bacterium]|nr:GNAT family N-acetyltransferase [Pirellulaceae bacterium]
MDSPRESTFSISPADPLAEKEVLALAALAWPQEERADLWREIRQAATADEGAVVLLAARSEDRLLAAALAHLLPGRAAVVWPPQFVTTADSSNSAIAGRLLNDLAVTLGARGAVLAQTLLAAGDRQSERMRAGGFILAAELLYMAIETETIPEQPPDLPFDLRCFSTGEEPALIALIDRTYQRTLDCPQIDGLRATADVVRGHRSVGQFRPELWQILLVEGREAGCLLVNLHPDVGHAELVYLGLAPEVRGRGYGWLLTRQAMWLARQARVDRLVLAVDAANRPAIAAYERAGLTERDRRALWYRPLVKAATGAAASS